ncbi:ATP-grasp domain-containing protein, partial [Staphylococcus aureus]
AVLKTRRMGYDGKGQAVLRSPADFDAAWAALGQQPLILEAFVPFEREVSCIAVRARDGSMVFYPLVENVHRAGILRTATPTVNDPLQ